MKRSYASNATNYKIYIPILRVNYKEGLPYALLNYFVSEYFSL